MADSGSSLQRTPSWALAVVCFCIVSVSVLIENSIHRLTYWLKKHRRTALYDAVWSLKSALRLLGFMSLLLSVLEDYILKICVPREAANTMLPCRGNGSFVVNYYVNESFAHVVTWSHEDGDTHYGMNNYGNTTTDSCSSQGKVSLMTAKGIQELQVFIFVLAVMQIVYSILTMALGRAKMRRWKAWEKETKTIEYRVANDPNRFRYTRDTSFGRRHETCTETTIQLWIKCFFRQFSNSVAKVDYLTLRHGFINAHLSPNFHSFDFQTYIEGSLDEDFKVIVSISPVMWFLVVIFMLLDVDGWHSYLWISYIPLLIILVVGTKLEVIVAKMALQFKMGNNVTRGAPLVQPNNDLFWFGRPNFLLHLLHFTLFVNAFELAFFIWVMIQFGYDSCYHENTAFTIIRTVLAVSVQILCSYITLPLYALVTQMGSELRGTILKEHVARLLKQWHAEVRDRREKQQEQSVHMQSQIRDRIKSRTMTIISCDAPTSVPTEANSMSNVGEIKNSTSNVGEIKEEQEEE